MLFPRNHAHYVFYTAVILAPKNNFLTSYYGILTNTAANTSDSNATGQLFFTMTSFAGAHVCHIKFV